MTWKNLAEELDEEFASLQTGRVGQAVIAFNTERRKYDAEEYRRRRKLGMCVHCSERARPGHATCERHGPRPGYLAPSRVERRVRLSAAASRERGDKISALYAAGWSQCRIATHLGVDRKTVRRQLRLRVAGHILALPRTDGPGSIGGNKEPV